MEHDKVVELRNKTIKLLEKTKKQQNVYAEQRKKLYNYFVNQSNLIEWEKYIEEVEELINKDII